MKKSTIFLFSFVIASGILLGCQPEMNPTVDTVDDTTQESDNSTEEAKIPSIELDTVLGKTEYDLITRDPKSQKTIVTTAQTNLGNLCADAYRYAANADAAIVCAGEIGEGIAAGDITVAAVLAALPGESNLITVYATGAEILDCLEIAYQALPDPGWDYMHLSGISLVLDMNKKPSIQTDESGMLIGISGDRRVKDVRIGGNPLLPESTYTITLSDSVSDQVAGIFSDNRIVSNNTTSNSAAVMSYISDALAGVIGDQYQNPYGDQRIRTIPPGQTEVPTSTSLLPQVYITAREDAKRSAYVPCVITVHDPTGVYGDIYDTESTIKIRGHSTSVGEKAPYNIKFGSKVELLGLGKSKRWNLLANLYDKTQLRNTMALTFAQNIGVNYTSSSCFAEVYLNGEYRGMYQICEPIDVSKTQVDINTKNNEYLLELEPYAGYSNYYSLTTPVMQIVFGYNEPESPTGEQRTWLKNFMADVEHALVSGDYDKVKECVDVDSFARCYIVQELFKNVDYLQSSTRFYVKENKLYEGPVWDFDLSSGNCSQSYYATYNNVDTSGLSYEGLYCVGLYNEYLFRYEQFRQLVSELYAELQPIIVNLYSDNELGQNRIDCLLEAYREDVDRNYTLWSTKIAYSLYEHKPVDRTYDGEIEFLRNWLENRNQWLYDYYCQSTP